MFDKASARQFTCLFFKVCKDLGAHQTNFAQYPLYIMESSYALQRSSNNDKRRQ